MAALKKNLNNGLIERITIVAERGARLLYDEKIVYYDIDTRPKFRDLLGIARRRSQSRCFIVANSDIYFNDSLSLAIDSIKSSECYALTRWEVDSESNIQHRGVYYSQDAWIFKTNREMSCIGNYNFGLFGCDLRFAHELEEIGFRLKNPSFSIQAIHLHASGVRAYIPGKYDESMAGGKMFLVPRILIRRGSLAKGYKYIPKICCIGIKYIYEIRIRYGAYKIYRNVRKMAIVISKELSPAFFEWIKMKLSKQA